ncbi:MAG TPA: hypothetical protein VFT86_02705 [Gaiellaceae bacterium]|nr:hypothetical protein [Gaiellaceae bacterium]
MGARRPRLLPLALLAATVLVIAPEAGAATGDEAALAQKYGPVVRLVEQKEECGPGEPFIPLDVDLLFGQPTVSLRGPWNATDLVEIGPSAKDLVNRFEYHLDFPGSALSPGCDYERWQNRLAPGGGSPTVYAHVATDPAHPGKLALQYWFFYVFNDFNNKHEGDWEMIQLDFDAADAAEALDTEPTRVGYSSHEGAERADWSDEKLQLVDGTHPVVYPAAGSHANKYGDALYLGSSAEAGVGCDDTRGPHDELRPVVKTIPSDAEEAATAFPWASFEGRWGELQRAFYNGPTGPNLKTQWTAPITWSEEWRSRSYAVPTGGIFGTSATDFFCGAVERGSAGLTALLRDPGATLLTIGILLALLVWLATRTQWRPAAPLRLAHRRRWGQLLTAAGRMYARRARLFIGIGVVFIPLGIAISALQALVLGGFGLLGVDTSGEGAGALALLVVMVGTTLALLGFGLVQAATACALVEVDTGKEIGPVDAYRLASRRFRPLLRGLLIAVGVWVLLSTTGVLIPVALWLAVRWALLAQVVELEGSSGVAALHRSATLVHGRWLRVASLVGVGLVLALALGPLVGALLILLTDAPLGLLNVVSGIVYALAMPFVAIATTYVYFDARVRAELEPKEAPADLPAEIELARPS